MRYDNLALKGNDDTSEAPEAEPGLSLHAVPEATGPRLGDTAVHAEPTDDDDAANAPLAEMPGAAGSTASVNAAEALVDGTVTGPAKLVSAAGGPLMIDPENNAYYFAGSTLKPLAELLQRPADAWVPVYSEALTGLRNTHEARSLARLRWYAGLIATPGILNRALDPCARYQLERWTETEREFPKHLRIARHLLNEAATMDAIVAASGVTYAEVADYINASHAGGRLKRAVDDRPGAAYAPSRRERLIARLNKPLFTR